MKPMHARQAVIRGELTVRQPSLESRRQFVWRVSALCTGALASAATPSWLAAWSLPAHSTAQPDHVAAQWARLRRGLSPTTIASYEQIARTLAPRAIVLLTRPDWEAAMINAVVDVLKKGRAYPDKRPRFDAECERREADRVRSEAGDVRPGNNAVGAALGTAGASVATVAPVGPVIVAVLAAIASVIIVLAQQQVPPAPVKLDARQRLAQTRLRRLRDDLVRKVAVAGDCDLFGKRVS